MPRDVHPALDRLDQRIWRWTARYGHAAHRCSLGAFFVWMGLLKVFGRPTGSSLLADTIWFGTPEVMVPALGWWEVAIGLGLLVRLANRAALLLLVLRLPGTFLALVLLPETCFESVPFVPTPAGQYLIKDLILFSAALVIGATVRMERRPAGAGHPPVFH